MNELKTKPIWVTWKYKADGGKLPISVITGRETGTNPSHSHEWVVRPERALLIAVIGTAA